jgi:hypothetical protein
MFDASQTSASRINGGAAAAPRLYDEFASKGMPSSVGAPQGNFLGGLDMGTPQAFLPYTFFRIVGFEARCRRGHEHLVEKSRTPN